MSLQCHYKDQHLYVKRVLHHPKQRDAFDVPGHRDITGNDSVNSIAKLHIKYRPYGYEAEKVRDNCNHEVPVR